MREKNIKTILAILLAAMLLFTQAYADSSIIFTAPGGENQDAEAAAAAKIESMMDLIKSGYYKDVTDEELLDGAMKGMFEALDKHSTYFTTKEYEEFNSEIEGEFDGVGMVIEKSKDGRITVVSPIEDTPAYHAGILTGDVILKANDSDLSGLSVEEAADKIKGQAGTKVILEVLRQGEKELLHFDLIRETITINPIKYEVRPGNIGYIRITQFNGHVYDGMEKAIEEFEGKNIKGVVIDLRGNPGGLLSEVVNICQLLIPEGPIVHIQQKGQITKTYESTLEQAPFKLAVLVDGGSASASEIMAGAVKDSKTGILVGEKTYGKGTVQNVVPISGGGGIKLTIANYLTPSEFSLDGVGLTPDVEVKAGDEDAEETYVPVKGDRSLKRNMIGLDVLGMQQRLDRLGYTLTKLDGIYGPLTQKAVTSFQKDNKLAQDGVMDAADIKALETKLGEKLSTEDPQLDRAMEEIKKMIE